MRATNYDIPPRAVPHPPRLTGALLALLGVCLAAAGAWLGVLGGSWYYLLAGLAVLWTGALLMLRHPAALWIFVLLVVATPMTYTGVDGRQYVLVVAGGHGSLGTRAGDYVVAYALPKGK